MLHAANCIILSTVPEEFWGKADKYNNDFGEVRIPSISAALSKQLRNFPFWRGQESFLPAMEKVYQEASQLGLDMFIGEAIYIGGQSIVTRSKALARELHFVQVHHDFGRDVIFWEVHLNSPRIEVFAFVDHS